MSARVTFGMIAAMVLWLVPAASVAQPAGAGPARPAEVHGHGEAGHGHGGDPATPAPAPNPEGQPPAEGHTHGEHQAPATGTIRGEAGLPPVTDEERRAAFPELGGQHTVHDQAIHSFVLVDQLEAHTGGGEHAGHWNVHGWIGGDVTRLWFRTEGEGGTGRLEEAEVQVLYGRAIARWWDIVAGVKQDIEPGPARTWAAVGIQGLAPQWFEIEATAFIGPGGRTQARFEAEYELLVTNRLVLQPLLELDIFGKSDPERGIGAGLSTLETGVRLRYEMRREFAPYVGVVWHNRFGKTAEFADHAGESTKGAKLAAGVRVWF